MKGRVCSLFVEKRWWEVVGDRVEDNCLMGAALPLGVKVLFSQDHDRLASSVPCPLSEHASLWPTFSKPPSLASIEISQVTVSPCSNKIRPGVCVTGPSVLFYQKYRSSSLITFMVVFRRISRPPLHPFEVWEALRLFQ